MQDTTPRPPPDLIQSTKFWFEHGDIILQVEDTQFRVHGFMLSLHSAVFADMFTLPQPRIEDKSALKDGVEVVHLKGDSPDDWEYVLLEVYGIAESDESRWPPIGPINAALRLGKKYQLDKIFSRALQKFKAAFPQSLAEMDYLARALPPGEQINMHHKFHVWISFLCNPVQILTLAGDMGLWSILPVAYHMVFKDIYFLYENRREIPENHWRSLSYGSLIMADDYRREAASWLRRVPAKDCMEELDCASWRKIVSENLFTNEASCMMERALELWERSGFFTSEYDGPTACERCIAAAKKEYDLGRLRMWAKLPEYFFGTMSQLEDMEFGRIPSCWV